MPPLKSFFPTLCILILALLVRLIHLNSSFWLDEAAQALESARPLSQQLQIAADFQPPLFHLLVHALIQVGRSEIWLRLASLIPGLITVWLTIKIGTRLFNRDVGLTAGVLLATSQFHLFYSQELRPYSLAACLALAAFWGWLNLMDTGKKISLLFILASLAGLYTMYLFPVFLISLWFLALIFHRSKIVRLSAHYIPPVLLFLPWLPSLLEQIRIGTHLAATQSVWANIVSPPLMKMLPLTYLKFVFGRIPFDPNVVSLIMVLLTGYFLLISIGQIYKSSNGKKILLLTALPIALAFIISIFVPVLDPKRVMFALPLFYLVLAAGMTKQLNSVVALIFFLIINMMALKTYTLDPDVGREPWRQAVAKIEAQAGPDDLVIFMFDAPFAPWVWYQTEQLPTLSLTHPEIGPLNQSKLFVFDYLKPLYDPSDQLSVNLVSQGYTESGFNQYPGIGKIKVYAR